MIYRVSCRNETTGFGIYTLYRSLSAAKAKAAKWSKLFPDNKVWIEN